MRKEEGKLFMHLYNAFELDSSRAGQLDSERYSKLG